MSLLDATTLISNPCATSELMLTYFDIFEVKKKDTNIKIIDLIKISELLEGFF